MYLELGDECIEYSLVNVVEIYSINQIEREKDIKRYWESDQSAQSS